MINVKEDETTSSNTSLKYSINFRKTDKILIRLLDDLVFNLVDPETNEKYLPYVVEPSVGVERMILMLLCNGYKKETLDNGEEREIFKIHPYLAPYKVTILPLIKKLHSEKAKEIYKDLSKYFMCTYDESGSIGKRYRRSDACGTPFAITIDDDTINNNTVTLRNRDTMEQTTISLDKLKDYVLEKCEF